MKKQIFVSVMLFVMDSMVLGSGILVAVLLIMVLVKLVELLLLKRREKSVARSCALYAGIAIAITIVNFTNSRIAESRANSIIAVCEQYKQDYGKYPEQLSDLVPGYIFNIPLAKYTLYGNRFFYIATRDKHSLVYSVMLFGERSYNFELHKWRTE